MAGRTVYVGNVSSATDEGTLRDMFGRVGPVSDLRIAGCERPVPRYGF